MKRDLFYAVNGTGQGLVFISEPVRDDSRKCWLGVIEPCFMMCVSLMECEGFRLPQIKWSDTPVKLELSIK